MWKKPYGVCIQWYLFVSALIQSYTFFSIPVFRSRGILWGFYIKLKVSWLLAFLWCMSQTSRDRNNSRRVRTHEKNSGETVRRLGTIIQSIFVPNQEPASAWIFGNSSVRLGTQGLFRPYLKTSVPPFLPTRLTAPGSPRMPLWAIFSWFCQDKFPWMFVFFN